MSDLRGHALWTQRGVETILANGNAVLRLAIRQAPIELYKSAFPARQSASLALIQVGFLPFKMPRQEFTSENDATAQRHTNGLKACEGLRKRIDEHWAKNDNYLNAVTRGQVA